MIKLLVTLSCLFVMLPVHAQDTDTTASLYHAEASVATIGTSNSSVPFWMRSNLYGNVPIDGVSGSILVGGSKDYAAFEERLIDWGGAIEARLNAGNQLQLILPQAYLKARLSIFQIKVGRSYDREGLVDSSLSSGSFTLAGNALGIPKIELSIPAYWSLPFTKELFAIKGNFSYGWMGEVPIQYGTYSGMKVTTYYHHASLYGRFGKPDWRMHLYGAVNHDVTWGSDKIIFGDQYHLSDVGAFYHAITGKKYKGAKDISKIGNHLGTLDIGADYNFRTVTVNAYHQFFYDKGALAYLANIMDGLTGISISKNTAAKTKIGWHKVLVELFYSKNQAGEPGAKETPSGPEYYYNHAVYTEGFSYLQEGIGTPLITPAKYARQELINDPQNFFINNRVIAFHLGIMGNIGLWNVTMKGTLSRNYGDYRTSGPDEQWFVGARVKQDFVYGKFSPVNQFSAYFEASRPLKKGYNIGFAIAGDYGDLLYNTIGGMIRFSKTW